MNVTAYKGFTITAQADRFFFPAGSSHGYATMNHVKGAITKYLAVRGVTDAADLKVSNTANEEAAPATCFGKVLKADIEARAPETEAKLAHIFAEMRFYGMDREPDHRSRNKREGQYAGKAYNFITGRVQHWRTGTGPYALSSLKETAAFMEQING